MRTACLDVATALLSPTSSAALAAAVAANAARVGDDAAIRPIDAAADIAATLAGGWRLGDVAAYDGAACSATSVALLASSRLISYPADAGFSIWNLSRLGMVELSSDKRNGCCPGPHATSSMVLKYHP